MPDAAKTARSGSSRRPVSAVASARSSAPPRVPGACSGSSREPIARRSRSSCAAGPCGAGAIRVSAWSSSRAMRCTPRRARRLRASAPPGLVAGRGRSSRSRASARSPGSSSQAVPSPRSSARPGRMPCTYTETRQPLGSAIGASSAVSATGARATSGVGACRRRASASAPRPRPSSASPIRAARPRARKRPSARPASASEPAKRGASTSRSSSAMPSANGTASRSSGTRAGSCTATTSPGPEPWGAARS